MLRYDFSVCLYQTCFYMSEEVTLWLKTFISIFRWWQNRVLHPPSQALASQPPLLQSYGLYAPSLVLLLCRNVVDRLKATEQLHPAYTLSNQLLFVCFSAFIIKAKSFSLYFIFFNYNWHKILCQFQVYAIVIRHFYHLRSDPSGKSNIHLTSAIIITILLTIFPMLCFPSHDYFNNWQPVLLNPFTFFHSDPQIPSSLVTISLFSESMNFYFYFGLILFFGTLPITKAPLQPKQGQSHFSLFPPV